MRKPKLLILDEATSALDRRNERLIQSTLDHISNGVTTLTIAHRVKTIMNAHRILVLNQGTLEEVGLFHELKRFKYLESEQLRTSLQKLDSRVDDFKLIEEPTQGEEEEDKEKEKEEDGYKGSVYGRLWDYT